MIDAGDQWDTYWASGKMKCYRNDLVVTYLPIAEKICGKILSRMNAEYAHEEAMSDASLALIDCVSRYELGKNACFETFAGRRIWGALIDGLRQRDMLPRRERDSGVDIKTLDQPVMISESTAFSDTVFNEVQEEIGNLLGAQDEMIFRRYFIKGDSEREICQEFHMTPAEVVTKLDDLRWAASLLMTEAA